MNLYLVKLHSDATYNEGVYHIVHGYFGPVNLIGAENFRSIFGGNLIDIGPMERLLMFLGLTEPAGEKNLEWLQQRVRELGRVLPYAAVDAITLSVPLEDLPTLEDVIVPDAFECDYEDAITEMTSEGFDYKMAFGLKSKRPSKDELRRAYYLFLSATGGVPVPLSAA